jgi:hypothetical protein
MTIHLYHAMGRGPLLPVHRKDWEGLLPRRKKNCDGLKLLI